MPNRRPEMHPVAAIIWYSDETNYQGFKRVCADEAEFFDTHAEWLATAERKLKEHQRRGFALRKVKADPDDFALWCKLNRHVPDGKARALYASFKAATADHSGN